MARWLMVCACLFGAVSFGYREFNRAPDAKALGGLCDSTYECRLGSRCIDVDGVMRGQCSTSCNSSVSCANAFGSTAFCLGADLCARACQTSSDCLPGTECNDYSWCERADDE